MTLCQVLGVEWTFLCHRQRGVGRGCPCMALALVDVMTSCSPTRYPHCYTGRVGHRTYHLANCTQGRLLLLAKGLRESVLLAAAWTLLTAAATQGGIPGPNGVVVPGQCRGTKVQLLPLEGNALQICQ